MNTETKIVSVETLENGNYRLGLSPVVPIKKGGNLYLKDRDCFFLLHDSEVEMKRDKYVVLDSVKEEISLTRYVEGELRLKDNSKPLSQLDLIGSVCYLKGASEDREVIILPPGLKLGNEKDDIIQGPCLMVNLKMDENDADYVYSNFKLDLDKIGLLAQLVCLYGDHHALSSISIILAEQLDITSDDWGEYPHSLEDVTIYKYDEEGRKLLVEIDKEYWTRDNYKNLIDYVFKDIEKVLKDNDLELKDWERVHEENLDWKDDIIGYDLDIYADKIKEEGIILSKERFKEKYEDSTAEYFTYLLAIELLKRTGELNI